MIHILQHQSDLVTCSPHITRIFIYLSKCLGTAVHNPSAPTHFFSNLKIFSLRVSDRVRGAGTRCWNTQQRRAEWAAILEDEQYTLLSEDGKRGIGALTQKFEPWFEQFGEEFRSKIKVNDQQLEKL